MWYKESQRHVGYKIVGYLNGQAFSLANSSITYPLVPGNMTGDTFLGTSEQFCIDYYSGLTDEAEMLMTYSYDDQDIISGSPDGGEVRVRQARLETWKEIPK